MLILAAMFQRTILFRSIDETYLFGPTAGAKVHCKSVEVMFV